MRVELVAPGPRMVTLRGGAKPGRQVHDGANREGPLMTLADQVDPDRLVRTFLDLVAIDSPTGHERNIGRELAERFRQLGCQVTQDPVGNLTAVLPGKRVDTVLVSTHMDTAGSDTGIRPIVADGVIRTDGSSISVPTTSPASPDAWRFLRC